MRVEKTPARKAVEIALREAKAPLSAQALAAITGYEEIVVRRHLNNMLTHEQVRNENAGKAGHALYVLERPREVAASVVRFSGTYTGERAAPVRPGALDAFAKPSLSPTGERTPRKVPMLMGAQT